MFYQVPGQMRPSMLCSDCVSDGDGGGVGVGMLAALMLLSAKCGDHEPEVLSTSCRADVPDPDHACDSSWL